MERSREAYWQAVWAREHLSVATRIPGREKFYALVAYPGTSGFLHVGHLRGLVIADALHRYHRMLGHQVFFPTGAHASGLPAVTFAQRVHDRDPATLEQLESHRIDPIEWGRLEDPETAARILGQSYLETFRRAGFLVDESAYLTTVDEDYQAFIRWQFHRLHDRHALVQAPHFSAVCPVCGPVSVDASETDLASGGDAEVIRYTTVPFALEDGRILLAATLRPETVYGVTNLWLAPDESLVVWHHEHAEYLVARPGAERLVEQHGGKIGHETPAQDLVTRMVTVPFLGRRVPILASKIVDPQVGTGVVMSVPAHAPVDHLALRELSETDRAQLGEVPVIITLTKPETWTASERALNVGEGTPAERAARATGARTLQDVGALGEATERLYRLELTRGRMATSEYSGESVADAREKVASPLKALGTSRDLQEFSKPVICRNGHQVVIRRVPEQWFLHYSDRAWKDLTLDLVGRMTNQPQDYGKELPSILEWFQDRPCTRRGRWLGTPFPYDPEWIIEPIADSTLYPAYFVIRRYVHDGRLRVSQLTDAFFDSVILGTGPGEPSVEASLRDELRSEFLYWYPLDLNIGGKEHKRVHFPVFLYTHALLLPRELEPRGIFIHWWMTGESGAKLSKKQVGRGGAMVGIDEAFQEWGADALRLFHATGASPFQDVEWNPEQVEVARTRLEEIERMVPSMFRSGDGPPELDAWLESEMHGVVHAVRGHLATVSIREAGELIYVRIPNLIRRYTTRGGTSGRLLQRIARAWIRMMAPITPHLAEELGEHRFAGLVSVEPFPTPDEFETNPTAMEEEAFLERLEDDLRAVLRAATDRGQRLDEAVFYIAAPWKRTVEGWMREVVEAGRLPSVAEMMQRVARHPELAAYRAEIPGYVQRVTPQLRSEPPLSPIVLDEHRALRTSEGYLLRRFQFRQISVYPETEAAPHDPKGRRERARPGRPAFYLLTTV
ncbi:MAG: class I tRNA ligase family protein [Thermoplasmata archaeon]